MPAGRPTEYQPSYGEEIISLMAMGLSLTAAAADLGFHRQRAYEWKERYPEFADAVKMGMAKRQLFLEKRLLTEDNGPKVTATIFALKNAGPEDWRDKHEVTGADGKDLIPPTDHRHVAKAILAVLGTAALEQTEGTSG